MGTLDVDDGPANVIKIDANQYESAPITSVTVYIADRATVVRRIPVELKVFTLLNVPWHLSRNDPQIGKNEITVHKLPTILEPESIRVETETTIHDQDLVVFDVYHSDATSASQKHEEDSGLTALQDRRAKLNAKLDTLDKQSEALERFGTGLSGSDTKPEDLVKFLDMQFRLQQKLFLDVRSAKKELDAIEKEIREATSVSQMAHEEKKAISVTSVILADVEGPADVILTYSS